MKITNADIEAARTSKGGWTKETLASWGVSWPPEKGWRKKLLAEQGQQVVRARLSDAQRQK